MLQENINAFIAKELKIKLSQTDAAVKLLDGDNTVPFIARYRKEATGELDEEQIRTIDERLKYLRGLVKRQEEILKSIAEQNKLTDSLREAIEKATKLQELEDLYLPYKPKKRTRAQIARENGLEPLANIILAQQETNGTPESIAAPFVNEEKNIDSAAKALSGALDIIAETAAEQSDIRALLRKKIWQQGKIATELDKENADNMLFLTYQDYAEQVSHIPPHRILAVNRGEAKGALKVRLDSDHTANIKEIAEKLITLPSIFTPLIENAAADSYKRLLFPSLEREIRSQLTENAEAQAIRVFGSNLKQLLLQPPLSGFTVLGLDPGYRTGCKLAVVSPTGTVLEHGVLYVTKSEAEKRQSAEKVLALIKKHNITLISIGNGTASYETEEFVSNLISENSLAVNYLITNEAGASVYSASKLAKEELPQYDVTIRGAVSIARRVQDPLAELVKIDPKSIGVGQYQHDVNQKALSDALENVVESAVNHVGVELNTASAELLKHVAGISAAVAKNIVAYRDANGKFTSRRQLLKVARLGPAAFTQCAGFLRIAGAALPLDNTPVHPESYKLAENILQELGFTAEKLADKNIQPLIKAKIKNADSRAIAAKLGAGEPTVRDILAAFTRPGRDPRADMPAPLTRKSIVKLTDLEIGSIVRGTVQNITDFGVFVDIGLKTAGLIHRSELSYKKFKHPLDVVAVGDIIDTMIISVDAQRGRIGLSLKQAQKEKQ
jgi:uncharacterized protein